MRMLTCAVCDDEPRMARELSGHISGYLAERRGGPWSVSCFSSGLALLESPCDFDLVFLDIRMAEPDGMETARRLRQLGRAGLLVFVTVLRENVFDAFGVEAFDYLLKPLDVVRFRRTMDRALRALDKGAEGRVVVRRGAACHIVPLSQIVYCEVQGRKIYLHQSGGQTIDFYGRMEDFQRRLDGRFFRCHRSYLVNLDYVRGSRSGQVILAQGGEVPVSRLREGELMQALLRCMKGRSL